MKLDGRLDHSGAEALYRDLFAATGHPISIDAGDVRFVGALAHQILLSAKQTWNNADISFTVTAASEEFDGCMAILGTPKGGFGPVPS